MPLYHFHAGICSRGKGDSVARQAAYIGGDRLADPSTGKIFDYQRQDVTWRGLYHPITAPAPFYNRQHFYTELIKAEHRKDSQFARIMDMALPCELSRDQQIALAERFIVDAFVSHGYSVDAAIHASNIKPERVACDIAPVKEICENPHLHIIVPFRKIDSNGFQLTKESSRADNQPAYLKWLREGWANYQNEAYRQAGRDLSVSDKSFRERGIKRLPTLHLGRRAFNAELRGIHTERGDRYRQVMARNKLRWGERERERSSQSYERRLLRIRGAE